MDHPVAISFKWLPPHLWLYLSLTGLELLPHVQPCVHKYPLFHLMIWQPMAWVAAATWEWCSLLMICGLTSQHCPAMDQLVALITSCCLTGISSLLGFAWPASHRACGLRCGLPPVSARGGVLLVQLFFPVAFPGYSRAGRACNTQALHAFILGSGITALAVGAGWGRDSHPLQEHLPSYALLALQYTHTDFPLHPHPSPLGLAARTRKL